MGGLVGFNYDEGKIENSYTSSIQVNGDLYIGGLVGQNRGTIKNSYASGTVLGIVEQED